MEYTLTEKKVLNKLGINDFKHMTKNKVVDFVSMLPYMPPEVAKAAIDQFPNFVELAIPIVTELNNLCTDIIKSNDKFQEEYYDICKRIIVSLDEDLKSEDISEERKCNIEDKMITVAQMMSEKDSENKKFYAKLITIGGIVAGTIIATGAAILGVSSHTKDDNIDNSSE